MESADACRRRAAVTRVMLLMAAALAGCAAQGAPYASAEPPDMSGTWTLVSGSGPEGRIEIPEEHPITLSLAGSDITGTAACNSYGARIERPVTGGITIGEIGMTAMGCEPEIAAAESAYTAALSGVDSIDLHGERLVLAGPAVRLEFDRLPPLPTAELFGTTWVLESLFVGDVALPPAGAKATLAIRDDGTLDGSTGCRSFTGSWVEAGGQIRATSLGMGSEVCPRNLERQDGHVVSVIGDGFVPSVEDGLLTLLDPGGVGLVYRQQD